MDISIRDASVDVGGSLVEFNKLRCLRGWVLDVCGGYDVEGRQDSAECVANGKRERGVSRCA